MSDDFWTTSNGDDLRDSDGKYESDGGNFEPLPDKTTVIAVIDGAEWKQDAHMNEFINLRWTVVKPDEYAGRKIPQKLWVKDFDPKAKDPKAKRDKARRMFSAIDKNAGGKLAKTGREPDSDDMVLALSNKPQGIKVGVWSIDGDNGKIEGNWVMAVMPKGETEVSKVAKPSTKSLREEIDDDVPF